MNAWVTSCNTDMEWVDSTTLHCWSDNFADFDSDPCSCTVKFVEEANTWKWHDKYCTDVLGGQLASIHSSTFAATISDYDTSSATIYIGLHDYKIEDQWINQDGTPVNWAEWNSGEPNDSNNEDCAEITPSTGSMNDIDCATAYSSTFLRRGCLLSFDSFPAFPVLPCNFRTYTGSSFLPLTQEQTFSTDRYASACTIMEAPAEHSSEAVMDIVLQEAICNRVNCCNENTEMLDSDTMLCYRNTFDRFEQDPCGCTVELVIQDDASWKWHDNYCVSELGGQLYSLHSAGSTTALQNFADATSRVCVCVHCFNCRYSMDRLANSDRMLVFYFQAFACFTK